MKRWTAIVTVAAAAVACGRAWAQPPDAPAPVQRAIILGAVARPGVYDLREGDSIAKLLAEAGGALPGAALSKAEVVRGGVRKAIDLRSVMRDGRPAPLLSEGDVVVVPENRLRVFAVGEVQRPGSYPIPDGEALSLEQALAAAGGVREGGRAVKVTIMRKAEREGLRVAGSYSLPLDPAAPDVARPLQDGDMLVVQAPPK